MNLLEKCIKIIKQRSEWAYMKLLYTQPMAWEGCAFKRCLKLTADSWTYHHFVLTEYHAMSEVAKFQIIVNCDGQVSEMYN